MNKKITYFLLLVLVGTGVWYFYQLGSLSVETQNQLYDKDLPIVVICMLATGAALAFPSLLSEKTEKKTEVQEQIEAQTEETHVTAHETKFSTDQLLHGLQELKTDSVEKRFWYFCEYYKINLACLYKVEEDKNLKIEHVYGISLAEDDHYISGTDSLAALSLQSGTIEIINEVPERYFSVQSGLGNIKPTQLIFLPILEPTTYVLELASFSQYDQEELLAMQESVRKVVMVA